MTERTVEAQWPPVGWHEVERDDSENDIEVIQHWVPADGRWHTYVKDDVQGVATLPTKLTEAQVQTVLGWYAWVEVVDDEDMELARALRGES